MSKGTFSDTQMTAAQRKRLAQLLEEEGIEAPGQQHIPRRKSDDNLQLSFAQQRLWLLDQLEPANAAYNVSRFFQLHGPLNVTALERALNEIVRRHESLRTTFTASDGVPRQVIAPFTPMRLTAVDLTGTDETTLRELATEEARRPFDLAAGPLFRAALLRLADDDHALFITMHHIVSDGWSIGVLTRELCACYQAFATNLSAPLAELPIQYADFAQWQCEQLQGEALEKLLSYWRRQLEGAPPVLDLRMSQPRPAMQSYAGAYQMLNIDAGITRSLREIGRREHCTLYMTLLAAFAVMLSRYSDETDIVVGSPIAGRNLPELEQLIGFFVNTLVLRLDLKGDPNFLQLLQKVREVCLDAYAHQEVPFEKLVGELQPERDLSHSPLFQVMFSLQNVPDEELQLGELRLRPFDVDRGSSKFALSLIMKEVEGRLDGQISYNTDLFEADAIQRMCGHWQTLLEGIAQRPEARVSELPLLTAAERQQVLIEWNQTASEYPRDKCIHQLFETQVEQTPEATALICGNDRLSYRELNSRANQLAHYLQARGVGPEQRVGILLDRTVEMIVSLLAVLKASGVYVPLDTAYPQKRIAFMLEDAGAHALLTERRLVFGGDHSISICLDEDREQIAAQPQHNPANAAFPENLGYVIYTSGSTGRPKGVAIEHRSAVTLLHWTRENYSTVELSGVLASTSICFDLSVFEIFGPLSWGGTVILVNNVLSLLEQTHPVQLINTVPSAIDPLLKAKAIPATVSTVNLAGEELPGPLVQRLYEEAGVDRVWNLYGPSEDTTYSTAALIERGSKQKPPIGRPISDTQAYILDRHYRPVPVGVTGQLFLGGAGLARGYLHNPQQTAERFIPDPFNVLVGGRLYRTGDLARFSTDGEIEYLGRSDHQIKLRGYRIELGEIEAVLSKHEAIKEAVVVVKEIAGDKRLVAYTVKAGEVMEPELIRYMQQHLPQYMIPQAFVWLPEIPLTANGKVNRDALPDPEIGEAKIESRALTPVEEVVAAVLADVLHVKQVGLEDNFFELGGHSLLGTQVISRLRELLRVELPLRALFEFPNVQALSQQIIASEVRPGQTEKIAKVLRMVMSEE